MATEERNLHEERDRGVLTPTVLWSTMFVVLVGLQYVAGDLLDRGRQASWLPVSMRDLLDSWSQFDGPEYLKIAANGYWYTAGERTPVVWFPLYPLLVRLASGPIGDSLVAGVAVSATAGLTAALLYWTWMRGQGIDRSARAVPFLVLFLYPYGWYLYGVVHSDALFLLLAIGAFLLVERRSYVMAGLVGALATATRPTGMALIPALFVLALERDGVLAWQPGHGGRWDTWQIPRWQRGRLRWEPFGVLLCLLGIGTYMVFLWVRFGDPRLFATNQRVYHPGDLPLLKRAFFVRWRDFSDDPRYALTVGFQALCVAGTLFSTPFVGRRFGWGYGVFLAVLVAIPTFSTEDFMGTGRYLIAAFPAAAVTGEWLVRRGWAVRWLVLSGVVMVGLAMGFSRSWYLT